MFPPFNTFLKKKLKPNNLKTTPLIPNSFDTVTLSVQAFDVNSGNWTYSFNPQILRREPVIALGANVHINVYKYGCPCTHTGMYVHTYIYKSFLEQKCYVRSVFQHVVNIK